MTDPIPAALVAERVDEVRQRIARAGGAGVDIIAVTKGFGPDAITAAVAAGVHRIGENYAQELGPKVQAARALGAVFECHFIGHLQTNKIRALAAEVAVWQSVDRESVVDEIAKRAGAGARLFVQVNTTGEDAKSGCNPDDVARLIERAHAQSLRVEGVMTMGPTDEDPGRTRLAFRVARSLMERFGLEHCSMGMSGDLELAVQEGATLVRIGRGLFGNRPG